MRNVFVVCSLLAVSGAARPALAADPIYQVRGQAVSVHTSTVNLEIQVYAPGTVRVWRAPMGAKFQKTSLSVIKTPEAAAKFEVTESPTELTIKTSRLRVVLDVRSGAVRFATLAGASLLREAEPADSLFTPTLDVGKPSHVVRQRFALSQGEGLYGLGQFQDGVMNWRGHQVKLRQNNQFVANPFLVSTAGYGVLWDNYSTTTFRDNAAGASFASEIGDYIDYYFVYGPALDAVVAGYRDLTGPAPLFGKWALGLWQSRERYKSQDELLDVVKEYRRRNVPLDNIVQDWQYWGTDNHYWNSTEFGNPTFPKPQEMVDQVHALNAHVMISVWPSFGDKTAIFQELKQANLLYDFKNWPPDGGVRVYDAFNPKARDIYWSYLNKNLFSKGIDAWWLDASEPEQFDREGRMDSTQTALGSFKSVRNAFPLEHIKGVYTHQRATTSDKRVFILTRSAFAGQQRYAAATWSGDIQGSWEVLRKQISGGLNFSMAGIPYWTTDIGGFFTGKTYPLGVADPAFRELYVRWFQFGAFSPLFRSHGTDTPREIYKFGDKGDWAYDAQARYVNLRYRMLPYLYSLSWRVTNQGYTLMRGLAMDFPRDTKVYGIDNQYMFGPSLLVNPVTTAQYSQRTSDGKQPGALDFSTIKTQSQYLPAGTGWYDFWTGERLPGGQTVTRPTPIDVLPLYVRAGSILPLGPVVQYATQKTTAPLELRIYPGADADFTLYEDENDNYNYQKGAYATIPMHWDDKTQQLTIGRRAGRYPGMATARSFRVVFVSKGQGAGDGPATGPARLVQYQGNPVAVSRR
ncbi:glycoside hydrolase family 31 protein [Hymenobacter sp. H14-R3]|uniref:glycoside hydrolase family 31 protein n=1 Tax=Hymenobacter sp. H14-R3 TaxID=3046308 RepID=UPI0024BADA92|nr:TIM-barrel domain-containing protein [Hymenobacter sp. H14-R3]MDJ0366209.1 glycoside hydrolase family 31 protein [Hymenobacter sp. H14-R3]